MSRLYLTEAIRDEERVLEPTRSWSSGKYLVVAADPEEAGGKLLNYLTKNTRYGSWKVTKTKKLTAGADVPLEKRLEILGEIFQRLPQ